MNQLSRKPKSLNLSEIENVLRQEQTLTFVAKVENTIVGIALISWYKGLSSDKLWIEDVVVDKASQGKGIGRALVSSILNYAKENASTCKIMLTSRASRVQARALYRSLGFKEYDTTVFISE